MKSPLLIATIILLLGGCSTEQPSPTRQLTDPPVLFSKTHSQEEWSSKQVAVIQWKAPKAEIKGYAIIINKKAQFDVQPLVNLDPEATSFTTPKLPDGECYFHLRAIGADNYPSTTAHYRLRICADLPVTPDITSPTHPSGKNAKRRDPKFTWESGSVCVKGYFYALSKDTPAEPVHFVINNGIEFANCAPGSYIFTLQAVSKTGSKGDKKTYGITIVP